MGYILPVVQHTHQNYHYRMIKEKQSPHQIEKPFRVILEDQYWPVKQKFRHPDDMKHIQPTLAQNDLTLGKKIMHHPVKGRLIDEMV